MERRLFPDIAAAGKRGPLQPAQIMKNYEPLGRFAAFPLGQSGSTAHVSIRFM